MRKWLRIIARSPRVRFYFYTRSWRVPAIRPLIDRMAARPNCRAWYSADRDTGVLAAVPVGVRIAWLQTAPDDLPPDPVDLVFRVRPLRVAPPPESTLFVCPAEDGVPRTPPMRRASGAGTVGTPNPSAECPFRWSPNPAEAHDPR